MGIQQVDRTLRSNRLIFEVRRDLGLVRRFREDLEGLMEEYRLTDAERDALRRIDIRMLAEMGVHPYFLPQVSRLFEGTAHNDNQSRAARLFAEKMLGQKH